MYGIIYKVTNIIENKIYIGKTSKSLEERKKAHLENRKYTYKRSHFYNALNIHGIDCFLWEILEYAENEISLNEKEIFWINFYQTTNREKGYNMTIGGTGGNTNITKSKEELSKIYLSCGRKKEKHHFYGKKRNDDCRNKITESLVLWHKTHPHPSQGKKRNEEQKHKMSISHIGKGVRGNNSRAKKVICIETGKIFNSFKDAAEDIYGNEKYWYCISRALKQKKVIKGFSWEEIKKEELK